MTKNKTKSQKNRRKVVAVVQPKQKPAPKTPFADAGQIAGGRLATMFNMPYLKGVGKWLGSGIGQIFGSGDYQIVGSNPGYNVLTNPTQIPQFNTSRQTNIVCHREYLGDILGTAGFNNTLYPLNPGVAKTFPWLSTVAQNYQQYRFHGLIFEFRPLITDFVTNGAPGVVVMATNYNADLPAYTTKQQMENSEFAVSVKPTRELLHGVECELSQTVLSELYVRAGVPATGQDLRLYDLGSFQFATQVNPVQNLGELWVSYCVEFFKPVLPGDVGGDVLSGFITRTTVSNAQPLGTAAVSSIGDLDLTSNAQVIGWTGQPGNAYIINITWVGASATIVAPTVVLSGLKLVSNAFGNFTGTLVGQAFTPVDTTVSGRLMYTGIYTCTLLNPGVVGVNIGGAGVIPAGSPGVSIAVSEYSTGAIGA